MDPKPNFNKEIEKSIENRGEIIRGKKILEYLKTNGAISSNTPKEKLKALILLEGCSKGLPQLPEDKNLTYGDLVYKYGQSLTEEQVLKILGFRKEQLELNKNEPTDQRPSIGYGSRASISVRYKPYKKMENGEEKWLIICEKYDRGADFYRATYSQPYIPNEVLENLEELYNKI